MDSLDRDPQKSTKIGACPVQWRMPSNERDPAENGHSIVIDDPSLTGWLDFLSQDEYQKSIECLDEYIEKNPERPNLYHNKGVVFSMMEDHHKSIECFDRAIMMAPDNADFHNSKGLVLASGLQEHERAIECFDRAIAIRPNKASVHVSRGDSFAALNLHLQAVECYDRVIGLDAANASMYNNKGISLARLERYEMAVECYDKAIRPGCGKREHIQQQGNLACKAGTVRDGGRMLRQGHRTGSKQCRPAWQQESIA